jgi:hypothetical protein
MESDLDALEYNQTFSAFSNSSTDSEGFSEEVESESINEEEVFGQVHDTMIE